MHAFCGDAVPALAFCGDEVPALESRAFVYP